MPPVADTFQSWITSLPRWRGFVQISAERPYAHAEDQYDTQYGVSAGEPEEGQGLCALLESNEINTTGPALEIGCGTGRLTYGLAQHYPGPDILITDPSSTFLRLTQSQFGSGEGLPARQHFALLNADDLTQLPPDMFSVIAMRSTLHHILNVDEFIASCARTLRPGGALVMGAEPNESGYVLMAAVAQFIPAVLRAEKIELLPAWEKQLGDFTDTVKFYCRRDIDKTTAEDKHLFVPNELSELGARNGLTLRYLPNATFSDFAPPHLPEFKSFSVFFLNYLQYCMMFDAEFLKLIRKHLKQHLRYLDDCYRSHVGPAITGVFLLKKTSA